LHMMYWSFSEDQIGHLNLVITWGGFYLYFIPVFILNGLRLGLILRNNIVDTVIPFWV
jgi:hypothetical protein